MIDEKLDELIISSLTLAKQICLLDSTKTNPQMLNALATIIKTVNECKD